MSSLLQAVIWRAPAWPLAWLLGLALVLPCQTARATGEPLRVGMVNAQSGPAAGLGKGMLDGARAVFAEVNARGGVHGRRLELLVADDGYEPERTVEETLRLVLDDGVVGLLGFVGTPTTQSVVPLVKEFGLPLVGVFSGAMSLRVPEAGDLFNVRASYDDETELLVARLLAAGARSIGVVYQFDGFGLAVLAGTQRALARRGLQISASGHFQRNTLAIQAAAGHMLEAQPDAVIMAGPYAPVAALVNKLRRQGSQAQLATVSFVGTDDLLPRLGVAGEGLLVSQVVPFPDTATQIGRECQDVLARHAAASLAFVNFEGCIAARVMVEALQQAGPAPTRQALTQSLRALHLDLGGVVVGFGAQAGAWPPRVYLTEVRERSARPLPVSN